MDQNQSADYLANRKGLTATDHDSGMTAHGGGAAEKIGVVSNDHPPLGIGELELSFVIGGAQHRLDGSGNVDPVSAQRGGDIWIDVLVKMEANPLGHHLTS